MCLAGLVVVGPRAANAEIPRGVMIAANEQTANLETGETIATGDAELTVAERHISGKADAIEVRPKVNAVIFLGRAVLIIGQQRYEGAVVTCTLDFVRCSADVNALPVEVTPAEGQTAAVTNPL